MFGLSTWEILLILVVALIFIGPDQLPKVARKLGHGMRQVRGAMTRVDNEVRRSIREATAEDAVEDDPDHGTPLAHHGGEVQADPEPLGPLPHNAPPAGFTPPRAPPPGAVARRQPEAAPEPAAEGTSEQAPNDAPSAPPAEGRSTA
jgi:sec-independent protein translocase protein TatB